MYKKIHPAEGTSSAAPEKGGTVTYLPTEEKPHFADRLSRNLALAGMLILSITAVRNAQLPSGQTVLTAVQDIIEGNWDESLGKISFVSNLLPETVSVFFDAAPRADLTAPCFGGFVSHFWQEDEPYLGYTSEDRRVFSVAPGQVMSLAHGPGEEKILRVRQDDGLETLYYNLASVNVTEGARVNADTCLGETIPGAETVVEVRRAGRAIDPTGCFAARSEASP